MTKIENWQRIGDNEFAGFGRKSIRFASADGEYTIDIDDANQDWTPIEVQVPRQYGRSC